MPGLTFSYPVMLVCKYLGSFCLPRTQLIQLCENKVCLLVGHGTPSWPSVLSPVATHEYLQMERLTD